MDIQKRKEKDILLVSIQGRVDALTAPVLEKDLLDTVAGGEKRILLDLSGLQYISSAGLRSVLILAKRLKTEQGEIFFAGLQGPVEDVFKISGFYTIFKIYDSLEAALAQR